MLLARSLAFNPATVAPFATFKTEYIGNRYCAIFLPPNETILPFSSTMPALDAVPTSVPIVSNISIIQNVIINVIIVNHPISGIALKLNLNNVVSAISLKGGIQESVANVAFLGITVPSIVVFPIGGDDITILSSVELIFNAGASIVGT